MAKKPQEKFSVIDQGKYYYAHKRKILQSFLINYTQLEPGIIIELYYNKPIDDKRKQLKKYYLLVLNNGTIPGDLQRRIHALDLSFVYPTHLNEFAGRIGLDNQAKKIYEQRKKIIPKVLITENENPKTFYTRFVKPWLNSKFEDAYKIFNYENIYKINIIEYDWDTKLVDKYLLKDRPNISGRRPSETPNE